MIGDISQTKHCTSPYTRKHHAQQFQFSFDWFWFITMSYEFKCFSEKPKSETTCYYQCKALIDSVPDEDLIIILLITFLKGKKTITLTLISWGYAWAMIFTNLRVCWILSAELEPLYKTTFHFFFHRIIYGLISALSNYIPFFPNFSKQEETWR